MPVLKTARAAKRPPTAGRPSSEPAPLSQGAQTGLLFAALILIAISCAMRPVTIGEADVFWHLATGRWMLDNRQITWTDPFSHTAAGIPWANHEWLFQILLRLIQAAGGIMALYATKVLLYTSAIALPLWFAWRRGISPAALAGAAALALFAGLPFSEYRPLMISLVMLALAMEGARRASSGHHAPLYWVPALFCLWANLHATFPLGLLAVGCFTLLPQDQSSSWRPRARMGALLALCTAATLLNPYFAGVWTVPAKVAGSELFMSANEEWRPPDLSMEYWPFYATLPLLAAATFLTGRRGLSAEWLLAVVLAAASFKSRRIIPFYAIGALPFLCLALTLCGRRFAESRSSLHRLAVPALFAVILAGGLWGARVTAPLAVTVSGPDGLSFPNGSFPDQCARTLADLEQGGNLFNDYNHGGFLHYTPGPKWKVFIDGRNDLYGEKLTLLYTGLALAQANWRQTFAEHKIDAALVSYAIAVNRPNIALALAEDPDWALVDFDDAGMLFLRRANHPAQWLAANEYKVVHPMLFYEEQIDQHRQSGRLPAFVDELRRRAASGRSRIAEQMLARALLDSGNPQDALEVLNQTDAFFGPDEMSQAVRASMGR